MIIKGVSPEQIVEETVLIEPTVVIAFSNIVNEAVVEHPFNVATTLITSVPVNELVEYVGTELGPLTSVPSLKKVKSTEPPPPPAVNVTLSPEQ